MSTPDRPETKQPSTAKPPQNNWQASEPFVDFKASHWVEIGLTLAIVLVGLLQLGVYTRQAKIMRDQTTLTTAQTMIAGAQADISNRQADIMKYQASIAATANLLTETTQRAFISATGIRTDKQPEGIPGHEAQFGPYLWFFPTVENGGNTPTKNLRISGQAYLDPSRSDVEAKLPHGIAIGFKQSFSLGHLPAAGPPDPDKIFKQSELEERQGKSSVIIRALLGPHVSQSFGGFGVPVEETKRVMQNGEKWFVLGSIHYNDRFSDFAERVSKYCFVIGFTASELGELKPTTSLCPHWNCADDECEGDKSAYEEETKGWTQPALFSWPSSQPPYPNPLSPTK